MDIDGIRTFVSIAELGGFTRAADRLHRSQPAISRRINLLEQELGVPLLERERATVRLSAAGQAFLPFAQAVLAAIEDGRDAVNAAYTGETGRVSLALVGTLADTHIVDVLRRFAQRAKGAALDLRTASSQEVADLVRRGEATLGLKYFPEARTDFVSTIVTSERMLVIVAPEHRLAGRRAGPRELQGERWIGFPAAQGRESFGHMLARRLAAAGLDDAPVMLIDSLTAQKRMAEAGFGIGLLPESSVRDELKLRSLAVITAASIATTVPVALIYRRNGYLNAATRSLIAILTDGAKMGKREKEARK